MINFLLKGVLRDRQRSLFPIIVVCFGVMITCFFYSYMSGVFGEMFLNYARYDTGHVKITTREYARLMNQLPNDLALADYTALIDELHRDFPEIDWSARIKFGGLLDFPDSVGNTIAQSPVLGMGIDLFNPASDEINRLKLKESLVSGRLPEHTGEILIGRQLLEGLGVHLGDQATFIGSTANGAMAITNFTIVGVSRMGIGMLDKKLIIADFFDVQYALDMNGWTGEILGYFPDMMYNQERAEMIKAKFNDTHYTDDDPYAPVMMTLGNQNGLGDYINLSRRFSAILITTFLVVMSIVLWNSGLISGLRRYGEMGVRLAIGESKRHIYGTLIVESILIGLIGSLIGTGIGLAFSWYLQDVGINVSGMLKGSEMLFPEVMRAKISVTSYYIGFIPGLIATLLGSSFSGIGIYKRQTANLMKDLES